MNNKIKRNLSTKQGKAFWKNLDDAVMSARLDRYIHSIFCQFSIIERIEIIKELELKLKLKNLLK